MTKLLRQEYDLALESIKFVLQLWRNPKDLSVMRDRCQERLTNPPACICHKTHTSGRIKTGNRFNETEVALVDELVQGISRSRILLRHRDNKPEIGLDQFSKCVLVPLLNASSQFLLFLRRQLRKLGNIL